MNANPVEEAQPTQKVRYPLMLGKRNRQRQIGGADASFDVVNAGTKMMPTDDSELHLPAV